MRGGPSRGPNVVWMLHETLRDTVAFLCPLSCSPPPHPLSPLPFVLPPRSLLRDYPGHGGCAAGVGGGGFDAVSGRIPRCFPLGGPMLALPPRV